MEDTTSSSITKEVTSPVYYPGSFYEVLRAVLKCLGLETELQQNPSSCSKKEDDAKLNHDQQLDSPKETSDPSSTVIDPVAVPPSTTEDADGSDKGVTVISLFSPKRPRTGRGRGGQIN